MGLQATLYNSKVDSHWRKEGRRPLAGSPGARVWLANMHVITPNGQRLDMTMYDDSLHGDGTANDGYYGALVPAVEIGTYEAQAILDGFTPDGIQYVLPPVPCIYRARLTGAPVEFLRTSQHLLRVVPANIASAPTAVALPMADGTIDVILCYDVQRHGAPRELHCLRRWCRALPATAHLFPSLGSAAPSTLLVSMLPPYLFLAFLIS